jgi:hypothetical protein
MCTGNVTALNENRALDLALALNAAQQASSASEGIQFTAWNGNYDAIEGLVAMNY